MGTNMGRRRPDNNDGNARGAKMKGRKVTAALTKIYGYYTPIMAVL